MLFIFFFNDTATTEIYTLSLHDALPISDVQAVLGLDAFLRDPGADDLRQSVDVDGFDVEAVLHLAPHLLGPRLGADRKSTRLNSSHANISYAVFCLKKKKKINNK